MSNYNNIREFVKKVSGQDSIVTIPKIYIEFAGDLTTAVILNQLVYWSDKTKRKDGYFYKSYKDWEDEVCLTQRQVKYSIEKLKKKGLVKTKLKRANGAPTIHYNLDYDKLLESIITKCHNPLSQNVTNHYDKMSQTLTESTTKSTTENTTDKPSISQVQEIYEHYLSKDIIKHQKITSAMRAAINARLKDYTYDQLIQVIDNYAIVIGSDEYWFTHKYGLADLMRDKDVRRFIDDADPLNNFRKNNYQNGGLKNGKTNYVDDVGVHGVQLYK